MSEEARRGRVLAVVVATDGAATLPQTLAALAAQDHADMTVVGVDNGSADGSRALLVDALGSDRVFVAERDLGFGGAVDVAIDSSVAVDHDLVLFVHDDLALRPEAVSRLVDAFRADPELAVAGTKLVEWGEPRRLQSVGMRIDVTGRADTGVDADEIDQGQHDHVHEALYVSTAGMMVDRATFDAVGRFDVRFHLFRDDLDLCWRMHLSGHRVEVVTEAVGVHDASASNYRRMGQTAVLGPRYFAERNTLAALLKNYGALRLLYVVPLFLAVGVAKILGFLATRRLGDAWQTIRAWAWNVVHLRETRRMRRAVQSQRVRRDGELSHLFARVWTRVRAYTEALGAAVSGGSYAIEVDQRPDAEPPPLGARLAALVRESPVVAGAVAIVVVGAWSGIPLLLSSGALVGGALGAWPEGAVTAFEILRRPWENGDMIPGAAPGPFGWVVVMASLVAGGSAWLAPRLLLLSVVPLAWLGAVRAGRIGTSRRLPRVAGATLYALSPPVVAVLRTGRVEQAVVAVVLPLLLIAGARALGPGVPRDRAWRATAVLGVLLAVLAAAEPWSVLLVGAMAVVIGLVVPFLPNLPSRAALGRLLAAIGGAALLLLPLPPRFDTIPPLLSAPADPSIVRALLLAPEAPGFGGVLPGVGLVAAGLLGLFIVDAKRRGAVLTMWALLLSSVAAAWLLLRAGADAPVWPGSPLLVAALAGAVLLAVALGAAPTVLGGFDFGWRQLVAGLSVGVLVAAIGAAAFVAADRPFDDLIVEDGPIPAFLASSADAGAVVVLAADGDRVRWQFVDADGPDVLTLSSAPDSTVPAEVGRAVDELLDADDPEALSRLGPFGVQWVVVPGGAGSVELHEVLTAQLDLTEQPVADGRVLRVDTWLPRWVLLTDAERDLLAERRAVVVPEEARAVVEPDGRLVLPTRSERPGRHLVESGAGASSWVVEGADGSLPIVPVAGLSVRPVPPGTTELSIAHVDAGQRPWRVVLQGVLAALGVSLMLRAPAFARRRGTGPRRAEEADLPEDQPQAVGAPS